MAYCKANSCYNSTSYSWEDYCSYHQRCLSKLSGEKYIPNIQEIETFETWFNKNCGYVINYDNSYESSRYNIWIVIYEPKQWNKDIPENWLITINDYWYSLSTAREKAQNLRDRLKYNDNPILYAHPNANSYTKFSDVVKNPYVTGNFRLVNTVVMSGPNFDTNMCLNKRFRPLDIVWVYSGLAGDMAIRYWHVGFYLGNGKICHFSRKNNKVDITDWSGFLENTQRYVVAYHPVIPFKNYKDIIRQAVWAKDNGFRRGNYNLPNRNCEHFTNMLVYGIDFSQQVYERKGEMIAKACVHTAPIGIAGGLIAGTSIVLAPFTFGLSLIPGAIGTAASVAGIVETAENEGTLNNGKSEVCLATEIRETNDRLGKKSDWETEQYERWYLQEVPTKQECRVM